MKGGEMPRKRHTPEQVMKELQVLTEQYKQTYNRIRPHSSLGYRPPAPKAALPPETAPVLAGLT